MVLSRPLLIFVVAMWLILSIMEWSDNFPKQLRFYSLYQMVCHVFHQNLIGDFAECGVWKGHSAYMISSILSENNFTGDFHIFDSFEGGLSEKNAEDRTTKIPALTEKQIKRKEARNNRRFSSCCICVIKWTIPLQLRVITNILKMTLIIVPSLPGGRHMECWLCGISTHNMLPHPVK